MQRLIILDLAFVEVANAIWKLHHRALVTLDQARQLLDKLIACHWIGWRRWLISWHF